MWGWTVLSRTKDIPALVLYSLISRNRIDFSFISPNFEEKQQKLVQ